MRTKNLLFASIGIVLLLSGCEIKDPIYDTPAPRLGKITLTTDWTERSHGIVVPESYTVCIEDYSETLSGEKNTLNRFFEPGTYRSHIYNTAEHITISGKVAVVAEISEGDEAGRFVHNAPGWFFSCAMDMPVEAGKENGYSALMCQQVRLLTLVVSPNTSTRVTRIEGYLSGVAGTLDLDSGEYGRASNVGLEFEKDTNGKYKVAVRSLGVVGNEQKLVTRIHYEGNTPAPILIQYDFTAELADFNSDKKTPLTLVGELVETSTTTGFTATINRWKPQEGDPIVAD